MTKSSNELKGIRWGFVALAVLLGGYALFTGILLYGLGHVPSSKWEFVMLGVLFYSLTSTMWSLALARRKRPGLFTYIMGLAGIVSLFYGMSFFA